MFHLPVGMVDADGRIAIENLDLIGRMGGRDYTRVQDRFSVSRPG